MIKPINILKFDVEYTFLQFLLEFEKISNETYFYCKKFSLPLIQKYDLHTCSMEFYFFSHKKISFKILDICSQIFEFKS